MKTLIITLEYPPQVGGIASYVYNFAAHVPAEDYAVYAPMTRGDKEFDNQNKWRVYRKNPSWAFIWPHWLRLFFQIRKIIKAEKIQRIFIHNVLPVGYVAYLIKKFSHIPYTIFLHGTDVELAIRTKWKLGRFREITAAADRIVVNSNFLKNKLLGKLENLTVPLTIIYPGPADLFFKRIEAAELIKLKAELALGGKKVLITVARLVDGKGYPHLARLLPELLKFIPNLAWLIVGEGSKKQQLVEMIKKNNLQNVVRFLGVIPSVILPRYYQLADLFVLLTHADESREEGWGTVFLEAAASGLAVVAGRSGGVAEAVEHQVTGLVVDVYKTEEVKAAILELFNNPERARQMGEAGRSRVLREFTWEKQLLRLKD